ncbi:hypothetical protein LJC52_02150 [Bacteroidales bacterium OttesenSCG-928-A17]|nr:hypothetical protein [Bacteroidales bacterium OttesenSCG-928-A17]
MKKYLGFSIVMVLFMSICFGFVSCNDDDADENNSKDDPQFGELDYSLFLGSWQRIYNLNINIQQRLNFKEDTHPNWYGERSGSYYYASETSNVLYGTRWGVNGKELYVNCYYDDYHMGNFAFEVKEITEDKLTVILLRKSDKNISGVTEVLGTEITYLKIKK